MKEKKLKLFRIHVKTYKFGVYYYDLFVLAENVNNAIDLVFEHPTFKNDEDAVIVEHLDIDIETPIERVIN